MLVTQGRGAFLAVSKQAQRLDIVALVAEGHVSAFASLQPVAFLAE